MEDAVHSMEPIRHFMEPALHSDASPARPAAGRLRVAVGMSGGLDSSVVAALLAEQGHEVLGLTLHLFKEGSRCCSLEDIQRARRVCEKLGIQHASINLVDFFEETIIRPFVEAYASGCTPSPCVQCNQHVKFGALHVRALQLGCTHVATGHYVRLDRQDDGWHLFRARDAKKDQSYFLHRLSQEQLGRSLFPLAGWTKAEAAAYAESRGLPVSTSSKEESQDLCFLTDAGPVPFVEQRRPDLRAPGPIETTEGRRVGTHEGIHRFTIGQRKGIGVAAAERLYVKALDPASNRVIVGRRDEIFSAGCDVDAMHWIAGVPPAMPFACSVRVRYRHEAARAVATPAGAVRLRVEFEEPQFAVTPGQAAVLYRGEEVLGGGWIARPRDDA